MGQWSREYGMHAPRTDERFGCSLFAARAFGPWVPFSCDFRQGVEVVV